MVWPPTHPNRSSRLPEWIRKRVRRLAREFRENEPAIALVGGAPLAQTNGLFHALAVNALNALVGSVQEPGGIVFTPRPGELGGSPQQEFFVREVAARIRDAGDSPIQVLLLNDTNPVFGAPPAWGVADALTAIPYVASFGSFVDETSSLADLILPDHSFLESWVDAVPESGTTMAVASLAPPAMRPLHETRAMPDVLLEVGRSLAQPLDPALPWQSYEELLQAKFEALPAPEGSSNSWATARLQGGWWSELPLEQPSGGDPGREPVAFAEAEFDGDDGQYPYHFLPFASQAFPGWLTGPPALASGAPGRTLDGHVEQLGGNQPCDGRRFGRRAGRPPRSHVFPGQCPSARVRVARHRPRT